MTTALNVAAGLLSAALGAGIGRYAALTLGRWADSRKGSQS